MAQLGRRLAILGIVLMAITMLVFGRDIERALQARCVARLPIEVAKALTTDAIAVEPGRGCQLGVELVVSSKTIVKDVVRGEPEYWFRYNFALMLQAIEEADRVLFKAEPVGLLWDEGTRFVREERVDATGGLMRVLHVLPKFEAPASGKLRIRAWLDPDKRFGATAESAELRVYDNIVRPHGEMVVAGAALMAGPVVMLVGVVLGIAGWLRRRRAEAAEAGGREDAGE
ncbi:MAG: hypothetical protein FJ290_23050 [Planctomycetes bacterium]|nr:hypothetical protein [Planctomycetota bacterium]